jgi:hypothetical protein
MAKTKRKLRKRQRRDQLARKLIKSQKKPLEKSRSKKPLQKKQRRFQRDPVKDF